ncbi:UNVERIFIED_CONTAM: protein DETOXIFICATION 23 [Sesamum angustifolium]|uniref:Protein DETOXIFICATION 23 n=1 Tax=Sesamum angustifolium TaxID=2727405 RepID=A0AAW2IP72_9LAMI
MEGEFTVKLLRNIEAAEHANKGRESLKDKIWKEKKKMWVVAAPAIFTRFTTFGTGVISQAFIGHIGSKELAAFALVSTVFLRSQG